MVVMARQERVNWNLHRQKRFCRGNRSAYFGGDRNFRRVVNTNDRHSHGFLDHRQWLSCCEAWATTLQKRSKRSCWAQRECRATKLSGYTIPTKHPCWERLQKLQITRSVVACCGLFLHNNTKIHGFMMLVDPALMILWADT